MKRYLVGMVDKGDLRFGVLCQPGINDALRGGYWLEVNDPNLFRRQFTVKVDLMILQELSERVGLMTVESVAGFHLVKESVQITIHGFVEELSGAWTGVNTLLAAGQEQYLSFRSDQIL